MNDHEISSRVVRPTTLVVPNKVRWPKNQWLAIMSVATALSLQQILKSVRSILFATLDSRRPKHEECDIFKVQSLFVQEHFVLSQHQYVGCYHFHCS